MSFVPQNRWSVDTRLALLGLSATDIMSGTSQTLLPPTNSASPAQSRHSQERQRLFNSISASSSTPRRYSAGDTMSTKPRFSRESQQDYPLPAQADASALEPVEEEQPRDPRDTPNDHINTTVIKANGSASPYTRSPAVDFDGLSWPSQYF